MAIRRSAARTGWFYFAAPAIWAACGSGSVGPAPTQQAIEVRAEPPGAAFIGATQVELRATRPATIHYNLEGQDPLGVGSAIYEGPLVIERTTLMTFLAIADDGEWSEPRSELYSTSQELRAPQRVERALEVDKDNYFYLAEPGQERMQASFRIRSRGVAPVRISRLSIDINPRGSGFFEPGVFELVRAPRPLDLGPGEVLILAVNYRSTTTLRSAALVVESDDEIHRDGRMVIELWGRVQTW